MSESTGKANTKWCPWAMVPIRVWDGSERGYVMLMGNKEEGGSFPAEAHCISDKCGAWVFDDQDNTVGHCGRAK